MMKKAMAAVLACLLLTGCGFHSGSYVSVTPHREQRQIPQLAVVSARNYLDLMEALTDMIAAGTESATINVSEYPAAAVKSGMAVAIRYAMENDPIGAYAVSSITYDLGTSAGQPAVAVQIEYLHGRAEIRQIRPLEVMEDADAIVYEALCDYETGVVMLAEDFRTRDFAQIVQDLAEENPQRIMETPQVAVALYGNGAQRVVELVFTYQSGRDSLRKMQGQVGPVFESATLYVSEGASQYQKFSQLYSFLMERFDYTLETSITPAYSLLHHGVGDSRAFATVYAAMCRDAGLECIVVKGTRSGEPWTWNLVLDNGSYYHVDLLRCSEQGKYQEKTDAQMNGYVWDYSAYPVCAGPGNQKTEEEGPEQAWQDSPEAIK